MAVSHTPFVVNGDPRELLLTGWHRQNMRELGVKGGARKRPPAVAMELCLTHKFAAYRRVRRNDTALSTTISASGVIPSGPYECQETAVSWLDCVPE